MEFPRNPNKLPPKEKMIDTIEIIPDSENPTLVTEVESDSDDSVNLPENDQYRVKCQTAENSFLTFVLHGTKSFKSLVAILKAEKLIPDPRAYSLYGTAVYVRVNTARKWGKSTTEIGPQVAQYGPYYLVLSVAVLDKYQYKLNAPNNGTFSEEYDAAPTYYPKWAEVQPIFENNVSLLAEVSMVYLQKIWIQTEPVTIHSGMGPYIVQSENSVEEIKDYFRKNGLAKFADLVEQLPEKIDNKYFVRYCRDWQTPLYRINGAVVHITERKPETATKPIGLSECYIFNQYIKLS